MKLGIHKLFMAAVICLTMFSSQNANAGITDSAKCLTCTKSACTGEKGHPKAAWCIEACPKISKTTGCYTAFTDWVISDEYVAWYDKKKQEGFNKQRTSPAQQPRGSK